MDWLLTLVGYLLFFIAFFLLILVRSDLKTLLTVMLYRKAGVKLAVCVNADRTVNIEAHIPRDNRTIKRNGKTWSIEKNAIFFDRNKNVQVVFLRDGDQSAFDPLSTQGKVLDPQQIENLGYELYYAGYKAAKQEFTQILYAAAAAAVLALIGVIMGWMSLSAASSAAQNAGSALVLLQNLTAAATVLPPSIV